MGDLEMVDESYQGWGDVLMGCTGINWMELRE